MHRVRGWTGCWLALSAASAIAGNAGEGRGAHAAQALDQIQVTANRRSEAVRMTPRAVTVVTEATLERGVAQTAAELLRDQPGVALQQTTPGQGNVIVRGLKGSELLLLVDGIRLNAAFFRNSPNGVASLLDPFSIGQVELLRGPASVGYGSDAMGGVIHYLTAQPFGRGTRGRLRSRLDSADLSAMTRVEGEFGSPRFAALLGGFHQDVGERRTGDGKRQPFSAFTARGADLKLRGFVDDALEWRLAASHYTQPATPRYDALVPGFGQSQPESELFLFAPNTREIAQATLRWSGATTWFDRADLNAARQVIDDDRRSRDFGAPELVHERNRSTQDGASLQFSRAVGATHLLSYGLDRYRDEIRSARDRIDGSGMVSPRAPRFPDGSRLDSLGLFVNDEWCPSERFELVYGLRHSRFDLELAPGLASAVSIRNHDTSGAIGLRYEFGDYALVSNLARGFRSPNVFDAGTFGPRAGNRFDLPNPDLRPESVLTFDLGLRWQREALSGEAVLWQSRYRDRIMSVLTGDVTDAGEHIVQNRNLDRARLWGLESAFDWQLAPRWSVFGSLTATRGELRSAEGRERADRIPPLGATLGLRFHRLEHGMLEMRMRGAASQDRLGPRDLTDPRIDPQGTPGWMTMDLSLVTRLSQAVDLNVALANLGDRRYREHGSGIDGPGRGLRLGLDWRY